MIYFFYLLFITIFVLIDQMSKKLIVSNFKLNQVVPVIKGFFNLTYVRNYGAGFSILQHATAFLLALTVIACILGTLAGYIVSLVIACIVLLYLLVTTDKKGLLSKVCYLLIISGAIGNFIDRSRFSYVIDFLDFKIFGYDYPVFNIADSFITVGCVLLIVKMIWEARHAKD